MWFEWVSSNKGGIDNESVDLCAQKAIEGPIIATLLDGLDMGIAHNSILNNLQDKDWLDWYCSQGHLYFYGKFCKPRHSRDMTRLDI